jgi:signal transduction histidine kinase
MKFKSTFRPRYFFNSCWILIALFGCLTYCFAQEPERYNVFQYGVNEGLLQSTMGDIAVDKNNYCWLSFPNGIQKFDGKQFINIEPQEGLPDNKYTSFLKTGSGDLLISHATGISFYDIERNKFKLVYTQTEKTGIPSKIIGEDNGFIYLFTENENVIALDAVNYSVKSITSSGLPKINKHSEYKPAIGSNLVNHKTIFSLNGRIYLWDLENRRMSAVSDKIEYLSTYLLMLISADEALFYTYQNKQALQVYNFKTRKIRMIFPQGKDSNYISRCVPLKWGNKWMLSFTGRLYETDSAMSVLKKEIVNFQNNSIAERTALVRIVEDNFGNLYATTISAGLRKIIGNTYPIRYYGTDNERSNYILTTHAHKEVNRILAGAYGKGLFIYDSLQKLIRHIETAPGAKYAFSPNAIVRFSNGDYFILSVSEATGFVLKHDLSSLKSIPIVAGKPGEKIGADYFGNVLFSNEKIALIQTQGKIFRVDLVQRTIKQFTFTTAYNMGGIFYKGRIISHAADELLIIDTADFSIKRRIPFPNTAGVRCFAKDKNDNLYAGSNKGIFKIDESGRIMQHYNKETGLPDECIYSIVIDEKGFLWCSSNKGIFKLSNERVLMHLKKEDGIQENEFNTNAAAVSADGEIFFAGVNGVSSFYAEKITGFKENIQVLITGIQVNNEPLKQQSAVWNTTEINLPYNSNALSFDFIALANNNPAQYIYQYQMEGVDKSWIRNEDMQTVRYHLQPGKYVFKMYASRSFDLNAKPLKEIVIHIHPPFWKTWWFISLLAVLLILVLAFLINTVNRRKFEKKLSILEAEQKVKLERERISRDLHDSLGAYANAVLYNTELLQKENGTNERETLIKELRFASKDIITSLRETIWALKKDNFMAEDCLLRIRNFIQPFNRYFPHIIFRTEGEAPVGMMLHYTKALHLVRIVQEAVSNSIKHAEATNILVLSEVVNNKWKITVSDDGKGFDYTRAAEEEGGNGLGNILQRAVEAGFEANISSEESKGTIVTIII